MTPRRLYLALLWSQAGVLKDSITASPSDWVKAWTAREWSELMRVIELLKAEGLVQVPPTPHFYRGVDLSAMTDADIDRLMEEQPTTPVPENFTDSVMQALKDKP